MKEHERKRHYHLQQGESCDYTGTKRAMLGTFAVSADSDWFALPAWELDASWLDLGDFIGGLFDPS